MMRDLYIAALLAFNVIASSAQIDRSWISKAPIPLGRGFTSGVVLNDMIYIIGGSYPDPSNPAEPVIPVTVEAYFYSTDK